MYSKNFSQALNQTPESSIGKLHFYILKRPPSELFENLRLQFDHFNSLRKRFLCDSISLFRYQTFNSTFFITVSKKKFLLKLFELFNAGSDLNPHDFFERLKHQSSPIERQTLVVWTSILLIFSSHSFSSTFWFRTSSINLFELLKFSKFSNKF